MASPSFVPCPVTFRVKPVDWTVGSGINCKIPDIASCVCERNKAKLKVAKMKCKEIFLRERERERERTSCQGYFLFKLKTEAKQGKDQKE